MADLRQRKPIDDFKTADAGSQKLSKKKVSTTASSQKWNLSLRFISRFVVISSLLVVAWYSSKTAKIFAKQSEVLDGKTQIILCSEDYEEELKKFAGCGPKQCKRVVSDKIVMAIEAEILLKIAKKCLSKGEALGGAAIFDLHSGALSKGQSFINFYKLPQSKEILTESDLQFLKVIREKLRDSIVKYFRVDVMKLYMTYPAFFSELTYKSPVTMNDEYWHTHVDKVTYGSFHYTCLVYLNDFGIDFTGGRFIYVDKHQNKTIEPRKGRVSIFTSGEENTHHIEPVTNGVRYAFTMAFTCDQKYAVDDDAFH